MHGHGYATEAARAVVHAAAATGRARLWSTVRTWNTPSFRILDKLGFERHHVSADEGGELVWLTRAAVTPGSVPSRSVRISKYTHACVRIEHDGAVLVIDPGIWSEPSALHGADAILITHEHSDHIDVLRLAGLGVPVYAPAAARISGLDVIRVPPGASFTAAGFSVIAVGARHAPVYADEPDCVNYGYLIDDGIYHPGDALVVPGQPVQTLFVPLQASWLKTAEAISFLRAVQPERAFGIHDAQINSRGRQAINSWLTDQGGHGYRYLPPGESADR